MIGAGVVAVGFIYFILDPAAGYLPECPFYQFTHLYCPGCGTQRGIHALLHGNISDAFAYNPLMIFSLIYVATEGVIWLVKRRLTHLRSVSSYRYTPWIIFVLVMVFWVTRNIPFAPFTLLAP